MLAAPRIFLASALLLTMTAFLRFGKKKLALPAIAPNIPEKANASQAETPLEILLRMSKV
jgi:hypothetical protein